MQQQITNPTNKSLDTNIQGNPLDALRVPQEIPVPHDVFIQPERYEDLATKFYESLKAGKFGDITLENAANGESFIADLKEKGPLQACLTCLIDAARKGATESTKNLVQFLQDDASLTQIETKELQFFAALMAGNFGNKTEFFPILCDGVTGEKNFLIELKGNGPLYAYERCLNLIGKKLDFAAARSLVKFLRETNSLDETELQELYTREIVKGVVDTIKKKLITTPHSAYVAYRQGLEFDAFDIRDVLATAVNSYDLCDSYKEALSFYDAEPAVIKFMDRVGIPADYKSKILTDHLLEYHNNFDNILKNYIKSGFGVSELYNRIYKDYPAVYKLMRDCHLNIEELSTVNPVILDRLIQENPAVVVGAKELELAKKYRFVMPIAFQNGLEHNPDIDWKALLEEGGEALFKALTMYDSIWAIDSYEHSLKGSQFQSDGRFATAFLKGVELFGYQNMFEYINGENPNIFMAVAEIDRIKDLITKLGDTPEVRHDFYYHILLPVAYDPNIYAANTSYHQLNGALLKIEKNKIPMGEVRELCKDWEKLKKLLPIK